MQVLLSDACQQQRKPAIAFVGATIQPDLSTTATSMVCFPAHLPCHTSLPIPPYLPPFAHLSCTALKLPALAYMLICIAPLALSLAL